MTALSVHEFQAQNFKRGSSDRVHHLVSLLLLCSWSHFEEPPRASLDIPSSALIKSKEQPELPSESQWSETPSQGTLQQ